MSAAEQSDGWIEWAGGECPVSAGVVHERKYRNGVTGFYRQATGIQAHVWEHYGDGDDIIAYRVIEP